MELLRPRAKEYFVRDSEIKGFGARVYPSGRIRFIAEHWVDGKSHRKTLGSYPEVSVRDARAIASDYAHKRLYEQLNELKNRSLNRTLSYVLNDYLERRDLKPTTVLNHRQVIEYYLQDWLEKPIRNITEAMVERKFVDIRDKGIRRCADESIRIGGTPSYSQATKTMRILSALMNYTRADGVLQSNPCEILKYKRYDRSIRKRSVYLPAHKAQELLEETKDSRHPGVLGIHLMLYTGLRKTEALALKWSDVQEVNGVRCLVITDTKNHRPHYVPISTKVEEILERASGPGTLKNTIETELTNSGSYVFPSPQKPGAHIKDLRPTLERLCPLIDIEFKCHDLRRSFATRASEVGLDFGVLKRLLNHKTNDITEQYIQWHSRQNLLVMREALEKVVY
ncbi:integrase family protein [Crocinitomicaceae bacterium]|nr:integrase family protein [Crocinitomicaceae bacterium]